MPAWFLPATYVALLTATLAIIGWSMRRAISRADKADAGLARIDLSLTSINDSIRNLETRSVERMQAHETLDNTRFAKVDEHMGQSDRVVDGRFEDMLRRLDAQHASLVEGIKITRDTLERLIEPAMTNRRRASK